MMDTAKRFLLTNFPIFAVFFLYISVYKIYLSMNAHTVHPSEIKDKLTIRLNTYRRLDLLKDFMDYYKTCDVVSQVQVVWSDQKNKAPVEWLKKYPEGKYIFEIHDTNSLSNRFRALEPVNTEAVLSIDDDLIIPCTDLRHNLKVWNSNKRALVGFSPRQHSTDVHTGQLKYLNWQYTWWSGVYSIVLTKASILHRDYLKAYDEVIPKAMLEHIDKVKNCEDIAMAYVIALKSQAAPVWVKTTIYEVNTAGGGISSEKTHFASRGNCLTQLQNLTTEWPWVTGYQKAVKFTTSDWNRLRYDTK